MEADSKFWKRKESFLIKRGNFHSRENDTAFPIMRHLKNIGISIT